MPVGDAGLRRAASGGTATGGAWRRRVSMEEEGHASTTLAEGEENDGDARLSGAAKRHGASTGTRRAKTGPAPAWTAKPTRPRRAAAKVVGPQKKFSQNFFDLKPGMEVVVIVSHVPMGILAVIGVDQRFDGASRRYTLGETLPLLQGPEF